ncbi:TolC family protein [Cycloclasticus sp.]|uniref:TolC family protein n=1 Tax=Cycloclasticus sp. TaxID=2024830 RepID=UPI000C0EF030|nr:TolC family protein [Cycloclasticus sp.]PHR52043.1 MAG: hypothetical protein COA48_02935 [Cycloclasticus sp.]
MLLIQYKHVPKKPTFNRFFGHRLSVHVGLLFAIYIAVSTPVYAADYLEKSLSMQEAISRSLSLHPELASIGYRIKSAEGDIKYAAVGQKPELSLAVEDALGTGDYSGLDNAQSTLSIGWILDEGLSGSRVGKYQVRKTLIEIERDIKRFDIAAQTAHQFSTVLALQENLSIAKRAQQHTKVILFDIVKRVKAGKAPVADQLRAEVDQERRELEVEDITHELLSAKKILVSKWGETDIDFISAVGSLDTSRALVDFAELEKSIKTTPKMRYFLTQQRLVDSEIILAKEEAKNRLRFDAGVRRYEREEDYSLTFGVSLPIGKPSRNQGKISALTAEKDSYQADANATKTQLLTKIFVLYEELKHGHHIIESIENKIMPRLERALKETQKAYQIGKYSYQEWSVVQQEVLDTQLALVDARLKAHNNMVELERLTGLSLLSRKVAQ